MKPIAAWALKSEASEFEQAGAWFRTNRIPKLWPTRIEAIAYRDRLGIQSKPVRVVITEATIGDPTVNFETALEAIEHYKEQS